MCIIINHTVKDRGKSLRESFKIYLLSYSNFYNMHQPATVFLVSLVFVLIDSRRKHCFFSFSVFLQFIPSQFLLFLEKYIQMFRNLFIFSFFTLHLFKQSRADFDLEGFPSSLPFNFEPPFSLQVQGKGVLAVKPTLHDTMPGLHCPS